MNLPLENFSAKYSNLRTFFCSSNCDSWMFMLSFIKGHSTKNRSIPFQEKNIFFRDSLLWMLCRTSITDPTVSTKQIIEFFFCCVLKMHLWHLKWMNMLSVDWCHHNIYADFCNLLYQFLLSLYFTHKMIFYLTELHRSSYQSSRLSLLSTFSSD